ncbi:hypothetical protein FOMPIDRAFT_1054370 [Fomitopsis schrenkii]|uniref:Uncharacterized protein n=1 Tax=Fomitopsis schrenkii TaxID=2126942 RepID=S8DVK6_FOMSC|nr:hypothetical protein FOMPIDRAFT_1054370 [Fomitopsis schrenkii]
MHAIYIHSASFDPAASSAPSVPGKTLARRLGLKRKAPKASTPVPASVPRIMAGLRLDCALVSLEVAQGRKEISHHTIPHVQGELRFQPAGSRPNLDWGGQGGRMYHQAKGNPDFAGRTEE